MQVAEILQLSVAKRVQIVEESVILFIAFTKNGANCFFEKIIGLSAGGL